MTPERRSLARPDGSRKHDGEKDRRQMNGDPRERNKRDNIIISLSRWDVGDL